MDEFFEDGDLRAKVLEYLDKDELAEEDVPKVSELYRELCMMCFEKLKDLVDSNPYRYLALVILTKPIPPKDLSDLYSKVHSEYGEFVDLLISVLLMRRLEKRGSVESPFTVTMDGADDSEAADSKEENNARIDI